MWKDNLVTFDLESQLLTPNGIRTTQTAKLGIIKVKENAIDIRTFAFTNKHKIRERMERFASMWNNKTIVTHGLEIKFKQMEYDAAAFGVVLIYPASRVDIHLADFGLKPGKRTRRLESICRRWGVHDEIFSLSDRVTAIGQVVMKMIPHLPDNDIELDRTMKKWRSDYLKMRSGFRRTG